MAEIGSGNGTGYPGIIDTNTIPEVNSPAVGKTKARKEVVQDLSSAVIAIQTELGTDPAGSLTDVKTFLQTQHQTDGTHKSTHGPHFYINAGDSVYANFSAAVTAAANKVLVISTSVNLDQNTTIPANVSVMPANPGVINKNGYTLIINGPVVGNPMHQWLSGFSAGNVTFGAENHRSVYPCWFLANTVPGTTDMAVAVQTAISSILTFGGEILFDSLYGVGSSNWTGLSITSTSNISIKSTNIGAGLRLLATPTQTLTNHGAVSKSMLKILNSSYIVIDNLKIDGNNLGCGIGLEGVTDSTFSKNYFLNMKQPNESAAVIAENGDRNKYIDNRIENVFGGFNLGFQASGMTEKHAIISRNHYRDTDTSTGGTQAIGGYIQNSIISHNIIRDCRAVGVYLSSFPGVTSDENEIVDNIIIGPILSGIESLVNTTALLSRNKISRNIIKGGFYWGINLMGYSEGEVNDNIVVDCGQPSDPGGILVHAITSGGTAIDKVKVRGNRIYDTRSGVSRTMGVGIRIDGKVYSINNIIVSDNYVNNVLLRGIHLTSTSTGNTNIVVCNNNITQNGRCGLQFNGGWNTGIVTDNYVIGNDTVGSGDGDVQNFGIVLGGFKINGNRIGTSYLLSDTNPIKTLASGATPSVSGETLFISSGTNPITNFSEGILGQVITILSQHTFTISVANIKLAGGVQFDMTPDDSITLIMKSDGKWYEISRSIN